MPFKIKDGAKTEGLPTVTLAGEPYFIARLPLGERIEVQLLLPRVRAVIIRFRDAAGITDADDEKAVKQKSGALAGVSFELAREEYDAFIAVVSHGLLPLYPDATAAALRAEPIDFEELFAAWPIVQGQGASRRHPAGEAPATSSSPVSSGDGSSPTSS